MNFKTTYFLFGVLVVVLGVFAATQLLGVKKGGEKEVYVLPSMHQDPKNPVAEKDIDNVEIKWNSPQEESIQLFRRGQKWVMEKPYPLRLETSQVNNLIREVINAKKEKANLSSSLKEYHLDAPQMTVTLRKGSDKEWSLNLGMQSAPDSNMMVYVTSSDRPKEPMAVRCSDLSDLFIRDTEKMKDTQDNKTVDVERVSYRYPTPVDAMKEYLSKDLLAGSGVASFNAIEQVKLARGDKELILRKTGPSQWRYDKPSWGEADFEAPATPIGQTPPKDLVAVKELLNKIEGIRVGSSKDFLPYNASEDVAKLGLETNKPKELRIEIKRKEEGESQPETQVLLIGNKVDAKEKGDATGDQNYARLEDEKLVAKVNADSVKPILDFLDKPDSVRNKDLVQVDEAKVDAVDIKNKHGLLRLRRTEPASWKLFAGTDKQGQKADTQVITDLIKALDEKGQVKSFPDPSQEANLGFTKLDAVTVSLWVDGLKKEEKTEE